MQKILIIEDDRVIREELATILKASSYECVCLTEFDNIINKVNEINPNLILLDINLPLISGETILKEIRKSSNIPIIMVTSKDTLIDEVLSMSYGADDYITKPYNPTLLLLRISAILKRSGNVGNILSYEDLQVIPSKSMMIKNNREVLLTKNELIILTYLLNNRGRIVSRDEIMTDLWNNREYINDNALSVNISRLRDKLKEFKYGEIIETRKNQGYIIL